MNDTPATPPPTTAVPITALPPMTQEEILMVCKQIDDAKNGKGPMPEVDVMRRALDQIRVNRRAGATTSSSKKSKTPSAPVDLNALFS